MTFTVAMPKLGMTMTEGTVIEWRVAPGSRVEKGQAVVVIESEKTEAEVESPAPGFVRYIYVSAGTTVPCGTVLAALTPGLEDDFDVADCAPSSSAAAAARPSAVAGESARPASSGPKGGGVPITPAARKLAAELGVDLTTVGGTGPGGRITREDVEALATARDARVRVAPDVALEVPRAGGGDLVLLLPGFGTDASAFAPQSRALAQGFEVLAINGRGIGASDAPSSDRYDVATLAEDAAAVAGRPAHVVGASLGSAVAVEMALRHPSLVRSLVLITPFLHARPRLLAVIDFWLRVAAEAAPETVARALLPWFFSEGFLADEPLRERAARGLAETLRRVPATTLDRSAAGLRAWSGTRADDVAHLRLPVLVIGAGGDLLTPDAESIAKAIHGSELVVVPDAGHAVGIEAADLVTEMLQAWLARW